MHAVQLSHLRQSCAAPARRPCHARDSVRFTCTRQTPDETAVAVTAHKRCSALQTLPAALASMHPLCQSTRVRFLKRSRAPAGSAACACLPPAAAAAAASPPNTAAGTGFSCTSAPPPSAPSAASPSSPSSSSSSSSPPSSISSGLAAQQTRQAVDGARGSRHPALVNQDYGLP